MNVEHLVIGICTVFILGLVAYDLYVGTILSTLIALGGTLLLGCLLALFMWGYSYYYLEERI